MPIKPDSEYLWLEPQEAPECLEWASKETQLADAELASLPQFQQIEGEIKALSLTEVRCPEFLIAGRLFRLQKSTASPKGILEVSDKHPCESAGGWKQILDVEKLSKEENKDYELNAPFLSIRPFGPDSSRLLLMLSDAGSDLVEIREFDTQECQLVPGGFHTGLGRQSAEWLDLDHILICHSLYGRPETASHWPSTAYIWERGTDLRHVQPVFEIPTTDMLMMVLPLGPTTSGRAMISRVPDYSRNLLTIVNLDGTTEKVDLPEKGARMFPTTTSRHAITVVTEEVTFCNQQVPTGSIVAYDFSPGLSNAERGSVIWVPRPDEYTPFIAFDGLATTKSMVHFTVTKGEGEKRLGYKFVNKAWKLVQEMPIPSETSISFHSASAGSDDLICEESGLLRPSTVLLEKSDGTRRVLFKQASVFDASNFIMEKITAKSSDGTAIDYTFLSPKEFKGALGKQPVLMTGYGAFGITLRTKYLSKDIGETSIVPWLERGGSVVKAAIRGGGDRGPAWHEAARQEKRQKSYDDFIAVAEDLIERGLTAAGHIGVFGQSNGGLLSSVLGTQRPDLFGAVVSDVPLTDMLRFPYMGMGAAWIHEYGDPKDEKMADVLRSYSPFHNVRDGVEYPPFLVTISTKDNRVGAGHARKMVAKLKDSGSKNAFLLEENDGGHGMSDPFRKSRLMSQRISFFVEHLF